GRLDLVLLSFDGADEVGYGPSQARRLGRQGGGRQEQAEEDGEGRRDAPNGEVSGHVEQGRGAIVDGAGETGRGRRLGPTGPFGRDRGRATAGRRAGRAVGEVRRLQRPE